MKAKAPLPHEIIKTPDVDNLIKFVLDALQPVLRTWDTVLEDDKIRKETQTLKDKMEKRKNTIVKQLITEIESDQKQN